MKIHNKDLQKGAFGSYILAILLLGCIFTMASRFAPIYMEHNTISNILDNMQAERGLGDKTDSQLKELIDKRLSFNNVRNFPIDEYIEFKRSSRGISLVLEYEVRIPLVSNLDVIATFNEQIELSD